MCGIAGVVAAESVTRYALPKMVAALTHRGPDDRGVVVRPLNGRFIGLGHTRLAILDLTPAGSQPMAHAPTGAEIVFNGEIYNFQRLRADLKREGETFRGGSDTEVLLAGLARHGQAYLERLEGMYAFGFFDPRGHSLLLARDPAGIKPLYLAETADGLVFASETRALLASGLTPRTIDRRALAGYLAYGAVQHPLTLFAGVQSLPPGSCLAFRVGPSGRWARVSPPKMFWRLPPIRPAITEAEAVRAARETLNAAVKDHLIADVPVGLFLSSGLDSTILAGLAAKQSKAPKSFTVVFRDGQGLSEGRAAAQTAREFGLSHSELPMAMSDAQAAVQDWLAALDQPSIDGLNVFVISRAVRERGMKVALSGLGGDELFGGYPSFRDVPRLRRITALLKPFPASVRRGLARMAAVGRTGAVKEKLSDMLGGDGSVRSLYLQRRRTLSDGQMAELGLNAAELGLGPDYLPADAAPDIDADLADLIKTVSQFEFRLYQGNMLLRDADANGMAFGLEIRLPFLDQRMLDLAHAIPGPIRLPKRAAGKHLLRRAFADFLRPELLNKPKRGFTLPIGRWMAGPLRPLCEQALLVLKDLRLLNPDGVQTRYGTTSWPYQSRRCGPGPSPWWSSASSSARPRRSSCACSTSSLGSPPVTAALARLFGRWLQPSTDAPASTVEVAATPDADGAASRHLNPVEAASPGRASLHLFRRSFSEQWKFSAGLWRWLAAARTRTYDLLHVHALWTFSTAAACAAARRAGVPVVLRPCGMLSAYTWSRCRWKKWLYWAARGAAQPSPPPSVSTSPRAMPRRRRWFALVARRGRWWSSLTEWNRQRGKSRRAPITSAASAGAGRATDRSFCSCRGCTPRRG